MPTSILLALILFAPLASSQEPDQAPGAAATPETRLERSTASLGALQRKREVRRTALKEINQKLASATLDDERTVLLAEKRAVQLELEQLSANFESIATGIDLQAFEMTQAENFDLQTEVQKLIQPLIEELKEATEPPRQMGPPSAARTSGGCRRLP
ncbi:MAG: DNA-directed RNA polymerase [Planctomycetota bacterium]|jgi:hypothetical protein